MDNNLKKKTPVGLIIGIAGGAVAAILLLVGCLIVFPNMFKSPKQIVQEAWHNTFDWNASASYLRDEVGIKEIIKSQLKDGGTKRLSFDVDEAYKLTGLNGMQVDGYAVYAPKKELVNSGLTFTTADSNTVDIEMIGTDEMTYLYSPDKVKGYLAFPNKEFFEKFTSSQFGELLSKSLNIDYDKLQKYAPKDIDYFTIAKAASDVADVQQELQDILTEFVSNISYEDMGKETIEVNGETIKTNKYKIVVPEETLEKLLEDLNLLAYDELSDNPDVLESYGLTSAKLETLYSQVKTTIPAAIPGDFSADVYISEAKIVRLTSSEVINLFGIAATYNIDINITDQMTGIIEFTVWGHTVGIDIDIDDVYGKADGTATIYFDDIKMTFDLNLSSREVTDTMTASVGTVEITYNDNKLGTFSWDASFATKAGSFEKKYTFEKGQYSFGYKAVGEYKDVRKGKRYTMDVDECVLMVNGLHIIEGAYEFTDDVSVADVHGPKPGISVHDVTNLSKLDLLGLFKDNWFDIMKWYNGKDKFKISDLIVR